MPKKFAENVPDKVYVMGAVGAEGFEPIAITDADGERALPVFTENAKLGKAIRSLVHRTPTMKDLNRRGLVPGGVDFTFEEAARMALAAGCDYVGLDMRQGTSFRTFHLHRTRGGAES